MSEKFWVKAEITTSVKQILPKIMLENVLACSDTVNSVKTISRRFTPGNLENVLLATYRLYATFTVFEYAITVLDIFCHVCIPNSMCAHATLLRCKS